MKYAKRVSRGVLVSKPYDHINIPVETVDASGEKVVEVRRLGDLKKEVLDLTSWKDIEKDANDKIKNDFKKYDNLAKKVYDNGKGSKDYLGKNVAFDQRGRRVSNLRSYKDDVRNKNIKAGNKFHLKELAVKKEMETFTSYCLMY